MTEDILNKLEDILAKKLLKLSIKEKREGLSMEESIKKVVLETLDELVNELKK